MSADGRLVGGLYVVDRLAVDDPEGRAPLVVLIHGSMDRSTSFAKVERRLPDLHVIRYDRRGYGRSVALGGGSIATHADDLFTVLDGRRAVLVGHSLGGVVALAAAQRAPAQVRAVLAYEAPMSWQRWWPANSMGNAALQVGEPGDVAERFMRRAIGDERWERLPPDTRAQRRAEGVGLLAELTSARDGEAPYDPAQLQVPLLIGYGTATDARHARAAQTLAELVPAAEVAVVEGADHGVHLSHPEEFAGLVRRAVAMAAAGEAAAGR